MTTCVACGDLVSSRAPGQRYCSLECRGRAKRERVVARGLRCVREGCDHPAIARGLCRNHYNDEWRAAQDRESLRAAWRESYYRNRENNRARRLAEALARKITERPCCDCGRTLVRKYERGDLPQRCPECSKRRRRAQMKARDAKRRMGPRPSARCAVCSRMFDLPPTRRNGAIALYCPECRKLKDRQRAHRRRARESAGDVSDALILKLSRKRKCALCGVHLTRSKGSRQVNIDHIVPLNVGGTHTPENLRAICRTCNFKRPKDGSDIPFAQLPMLG